MNKKDQWRWIFLIGCVCFVALVIIVRLYQLQVVQGSAWRERAETQYVQTEKGIFKRGTIYLSLRNGDVRPAANMQSGYILGVDFRVLQDPERVFSLLHELHPSISEEQFIQYAHEENKKYRELDKQVSDSVAVKIQKLNIVGVTMLRTQWRTYPYGDLLARTVGFVGFDEASAMVGRYGLELAYEKELSRPSTELSVNFYAELFGEIQKAVSADEGSVGSGDVVTTIEPNVSLALQTELQKVHEKYGSDITGGIIMNPRTGEIYAMDALPTYNANDRRGVSLETFTNPNTRNWYEFGSIIKPLTMAAGVDAGVVSVNSTYEDVACLTLNTSKICNWDKRGHGTVSMQEVLSQSLNVGVAHVAKLLGKERFRTYFTKLQLGSETGIDAGGEIQGNIESLKSSREIEFATASYGHGIAFSPIVAIRALATLANGGRLVSPRIGKELRLTNGDVEKILFPPGEQVFSTETAETITNMLVNVVDHKFKEGTLRREHYSVAAKTGTAVMPIKGGYDNERFLHSFIGYFPAYDPQFIILLYTHDPKNVTFASETLTGAFNNLTGYLIDYYEIPPDR